MTFEKEGTVDREMGEEWETREERSTMGVRTGVPERRGTGICFLK